MERSDAAQGPGSSYRQSAQAGQLTIAARRPRSRAVRFRPAVVASLLAVLAPPTLLGQTFLGPELVVDSQTAGQQSSPDVGMDGDGDFTVVWESPDGSGSGVVARRFALDGTPRGDAFPVNETVAGDQLTPRVAVQPAPVAETVVFSWRDDLQGALFRRYRGNGVAQGGETLLSADGNGWVDAVVAADGGFVATWEEHFDAMGLVDTYLMGRRYDAEGEPVGVALEVEFSNNDIEDLIRHDVRLGGDGRVHVPTTSLEALCTLDCESSVYLRQLFPDNSVRDVLVARDFDPRPFGIYEAVDDEGHFVVAFGYGSLRRQAYARSGQAWSAADDIIPPTTPIHSWAMAGFGESSVVVWVTTEAPGATDYHVWARLIGPAAAGGTFLSDVIQVSETPVDETTPVSVAASAERTFAAVWRRADSDTLMARVGRLDGFADGFETGDTSRWSATVPD